MATTNLGRVSIVPKGEWNSVTSYTKLDIVTYEGSSYLALQNNTNKAVSNTTYWQLVAEKGDQGEKGDTGDTGETGVTGNGIVSIVKTNSVGLVDTYTITYTDGTTTTFEITNGEDGDVTQEQLDEVQSHVDYNRLIYNALPKVNGTGTDITLNNTANAGMDLELEPNTSQNGEPTPDNPQDVHVVTGDNEIKVSNENLFDKNNAQTTNINPVNMQLMGGSSVIVKVKPNTTYTVSKSITTARFAIGFTTDYPTIGGASTGSKQDNNAQSITLNSGVNGNYALIYVYVPNLDTNYTLQQILDTLQLEINSVATNYIEHQEYSLPLTLGNLEYCKIGDYKDRFFKNIPEDEDYDATRELGKWYLKKNIGKVVLDGSESWNFYGGVLFADTTISYLKKVGITTLSDTYKAANNVGNSSDVYNNGNNTISVFRDVGFNRIYIRDDNFSDAISFKTWLSNNNAVLYCVLTASTYTLLNNTLQTELNNIEYAVAYDGQTNISQENDDLPFIINAKAVYDLNKLLTRVETLETEV